MGRLTLKLLLFALLSACTEGPRNFGDGEGLNGRTSEADFYLNADRVRAVLASPNEVRVEIREDAIQAGKSKKQKGYLFAFHWSENQNPIGNSGISSTQGIFKGCFGFDLNAKVDFPIETKSRDPLLLIAKETCPSELKIGETSQVELLRSESGKTNYAITTIISVNTLVDPLGVSSSLIRSASYNGKAILIRTDKGLYSLATQTSQYLNNLSGHTELQKLFDAEIFDPIKSENWGDKVNLHNPFQTVFGWEDYIQFPGLHSLDNGLSFKKDDLDFFGHAIACQWEGRIYTIDQHTGLTKVVSKGELISSSLSLAGLLSPDQEWYRCSANKSSLVVWSRHSGMFNFTSELSVALSEDHGMTFRKIRLPASMRAIVAIAVNDGRWIVGTSQGIHLSEDNGQSFTAAINPNHIFSSIEFETLMEEMTRSEGRDNNLNFGRLLQLLPTLNHPHDVYRQGSGIVVVNKRGLIFSLDGGAHFTHIDNQETEIPIGFMRRLIVTRDSLYAIGHQSIIRVYLEDKLAAY